MRFLIIDDEVDASAEQMGRFFDHLRQVGVRGLIAEKANDAEYPSRAESAEGQSQG